MRLQRKQGKPDTAIDASRVDAMIFYGRNRMKGKKLADGLYLLR
jgi:hypothetical protein